MLLLYLSRHFQCRGAKGEDRRDAGFNLWKPFWLDKLFRANFRFTPAPLSPFRLLASPRKTKQKRLKL